MYMACIQGKEVESYSDSIYMLYYGIIPILWQITVTAQKRFKEEVESSLTARAN